MSKALAKEGSEPAGGNKSERLSLDKLSAERCLGEPSFSWHGEGNRQHSRSGTKVGFSPGSQAAAGGDRTARNRRGPTRQPSRAKTGRIRPEAESARSQEGVREVHSTGEGVQDNAPEGRDLAWIMLVRR